MVMDTSDFSYPSKPCNSPLMSIMIKVTFMKFIPTYLAASGLSPVTRSS